MDFLKKILICMVIGVCLFIITIRIKSNIIYGDYSKIDRNESSLLNRYLEKKIIQKPEIKLIQKPKGNNSKADDYLIEFDKEIRWILLEHKNDKLYFSNAFMDRRDSFNRLFAMFVSLEKMATNIHLTSSIEDINNITINLTCKIKSVAPYCRYRIMKGKFHQCYILICPLTKIIIKPAYETDFVEIFHVTRNKTTIKVPLIDSSPRMLTDNSKTSPRIAICLPPQYGIGTDDDVPFLIQWMEMMSMYGITHIYFYQMTKRFSEKYDRALKHYVAADKLTIYNVTLPVKDIPLTDIRSEKNLADLLYVNMISDCMYRNMYDYDYILFLDMDEIPIPYQFNNYHELLKASTVKGNVRDFCLKSAFFYTYLQSTNASKEHEMYPVLNYKLRNPTEKGGIAFSKCFVKIKKCEIAWNHRCLYYPSGKGSTRHNKHVLIPEDKALIHHYRTSCRMGNRCASEMNRTFTDKSVFENKYGKTIEQRTLNVLEKLHLANR